MRFHLSILRLGIGLSFVATTKSETTGSWRADLPWTDLTSKLSSSASLIDTAPSNYLEECTAVFDVSYFSRSNHDLINQPSGLCTNQLFCAYDRCYPNPVQSFTTITDRLSDMLSLDTYSGLPASIKSWVDDSSNPTFNLPSKVLFPIVASDVVAAIAFAKEHGLEVSVKNSGHNYVGASTKKDTLHINMNKYTQYATRDGVIDCVADEIGDGLEDQPCRLSLAKNKSAVIRVGGGENWDKTYRAVRKSNQEQEDGFKYHAVGGAAGTVSPMGWTFQVGLSGTTAGRRFGFGADQTVQLEMVLPNGYHVKFGPTEWAIEEGYDVPTTLSVSGLCNTKPEEADEANWEWSECPEEANINFDDLWFAVRGGGGGTWGVVTSVYLQIHEYLPLETIALVPTACMDTEAFSDSQWNAIGRAYQAFEIKFLLDPESLNVTAYESSACGWPAGDSVFSCYGEGSGEVFYSAWKRYLASIRSSLENDGIPATDIDLAIDCYSSQTWADSELGRTTIIQYSDYAERVLIQEGAHAGKASDFPPPSLSSGAEDSMNVIVPKAWILENIDTAIDLLPPNPGSYRAFGGFNAKQTSDGANSVSKAHRDGGYMSFISHSYIGDEFFTDLFPLMFDTSDLSNFPGFIGSNHAGPNNMGPLKSDWTKACPLDWTPKERDEKCISLQEAIYGTEMLKRLEAIKEAIDPDYMFDCFKCIGNNRVKAPVDTTDIPISEFLDELAETESTEASTSEMESAGSVTSSVESLHSYWTLLAIPLSVAIGFFKL